MIGRARAHRSYADDVDPNSLFVFIPGAIASGFLISMGLLIGDAMRKVRGDAGTQRKVAMSGAALADEIRMGAGASRQTTVGLRSRTGYGIVGGIFLGLAGGAIPGASWNFLNPVGYISDIAWIWVVSMLLTLVFVVVGVQVMRLAPEWLPIFFLLLGVAIALRFAFGSETVVVRASVIAGSLAGTLPAAALTWKLRKRRGVTNVPPSVRPLLGSTLLGRV